jgi:hypothetical protein
MSSLQKRIAVLTSLAAQLRELEQLRERVRKAARKPDTAHPSSVAVVQFGRPGSGAKAERNLIS